MADINRYCNKTTIKDKYDIQQRQPDNQLIQSDIQPRQWQCDILIQLEHGDIQLIQPVNQPNIHPV